MTWIQAHSGRAVDLLKPKLEQINAGDIAHALARIPRFSGHTVGPVPYCVAIHSVYVHRICAHASPKDTAAQLWALLHDGHEAFIGDISTPLKEALGFRKKGSAYNRMSAGFDRLIADYFGLSLRQLCESEILVKRCDLMALHAERAAYMSKCERSWSVSWNANLPAKGPAVPVPKTLRPKAAETLFNRTLSQALWRHRYGAKNK